MSETDRPELGTTVAAGGVKTNCLEAGEGPAVCGQRVRIERSPDVNRPVSDVLAGSDG